MVITSEWQSVAVQIARSGRRPLVVMVVGAIDTGKTTFCTFLARSLWEKGLKVAVVDADLGQSDIGLPTTIGMGFVDRPIERLREIPCQSAYFVGSISPVGHLLPTLTGTKLMVERALSQGAEALIVDTDGLVHGGTGWTLKQHIFELLRPSHVVLLRRGEELKIFAHQWERVVWTEVFSVPVPEAVIEKTREQRRSFRARRFQEWLSRCEEISLPLDQIRFRNTSLFQGTTVPPDARAKLSQILGVTVFHGERVNDTVILVTEVAPPSPDFETFRPFFGGAPYIRWLTPSHYEQIVVGLLDRNEELLTVGITFRLDFPSGILSILAPPLPPDHVQTVAFGYLRLALDGTELGTISPGSL